MKKRPLLNLLGESGQTAIEYILLLAVASVLAFKLGDIIKARVIGDGENCTPDSTSLYCQIIAVYSGTNFKRFVIKR